MNIVFFGSSDFGLPALKALSDAGYAVSCVVTQPDKKKGRGLALGGTAVKEFCLTSGLRVFQPQNVNAPETTAFLKELHADLFIVIAYGQIFSQGVLCLPRNPSLNIHASLLPKYRGAAPINWALIKGEKTTGISVMEMAVRMDAGPVYLQKETDILPDETATGLKERLAELAAAGLLEALNKIEKGVLRPAAQDDTKVSFAPRLKKEDGLIDWNDPAKEIYDLIRGCLDWPGAFTYYQGRLLKVYGAGLEEDGTLPKGKPGEIVQVHKNGIVVSCGKGFLIIKELQLEGKRRMKIEEFIAGHRISAGEILGAR